MYADIRNHLTSLITSVLGKSVPQAGDIAVIIDSPADKSNGDLSCNIALQLSRILKKNPALIASDLLPLIKQELASASFKSMIDKVEVKGGFLNFYLSLECFYSFLEEVFKDPSHYGHSNYGQGLSFCLEFVSANPTGPLTVAHGRQAAVGDTLVNILRAVGFDARKEYYVNDEGNQIRILGASVKTRILQSFVSIELADDMYQGDYIKDIANLFKAEFKICHEDDLKQINDKKIEQFAVNYLMKLIQSDLKDFGVHFDIWSYQSKIATLQAIEALLLDLKAKNFIYENEGAWWFRSTNWGDDKDRVVKKSNGDYTYLTPDIVYHQDKFRRGFKRIVNILGPDHHGYIPRIKAAAGALGYSPQDLDVLIVQLATIFRNGKEVSMSTRRGEFITLREVVDEVGSDAGRFFFLMRQSNAHLEFDLELAKKQSADNPVYYIQYAHARIFSIIRRAQTEVAVNPKKSEFKLLKESEEIDLMRKIGAYPEVLILCARTLEPYPLIRYLQELAGSFHKFYDACRVIDDDKSLSAERLGIIEAARVVLGNGLKMLGVSLPEKM